ncbi:Uncharacterised protein [BD1-7 clade bacterium]|uniref:YggT family protein n=1 Tax=BD1-7 clade bacterium TaxID=2029982 RepID=A0A5S9QDE8_9GAMM|nr:Uncharacterised protein [BD1-7 clade bacterium]
MSSANQAVVFLVQNLFLLYIYVVLLRFLLQVAKADFYNPVSQFIVKATAPILNPLRRIIPGIGGLDIASLLLAWVLYVAMIIAIFYLVYGQMVPVVNLLIYSVTGLIKTIAGIYLVGIIISAIMSWIPQARQNPVGLLVWQLVEPPLKPFRKLLPDMGGIDLSPIFAILILQFLRMLLQPPYVFI